MTARGKPTWPVMKLSNFLMNNHDKQELTAVPDWKQFVQNFLLVENQKAAHVLAEKSPAIYLPSEESKDDSFELHEDPFADSTEYYSNNYWKLTSDEELPDLL